MCKTRISFLLILASVMIAATSISLAYVPSIEVNTALVHTGPFAEIIRLVGTVSYSREQLCAFPIAGKVAQVYVKPGQSVKKGDLLFRLETSEVENTMALLSSGQENWRQFGVENFDAALPPVSINQLYEIQQLRQQMLAQIAGSQIRAEIDGIVDAIFINEKQMINASVFAARIVGSEKMIKVAEQSLKLQKNAPVLISYKGQELGTAYYVEDEVVEENMMQIRNLKFVSYDNCLDEIDIHETLELSLLEGECSETALIPLEAVTYENRIWLVEDNHARSVEIDVSRHNEFYVAAEEEWRGKRVILFPDLYELSEGCLVREKH